MAGEISETDSARAQEYALLAALRSRAPGEELLGRLAQLRGERVGPDRARCLFAREDLAGGDDVGDLVDRLARERLGRVHVGEIRREGFADLLSTFQC